MRETNTPTAQILSDGKTVWVNSNETGSCVARFCKLSLEFMPKAETFNADPSKRDGADWGRFKDGVARRYGFVIGDEYEPKWAISDRQLARSIT